MLISTDSVTFCATKDYQLKTDRRGIKKKKLSNDASHWGSPCMVGVIMQDVHWNIVERICTPSSMSWSKGVRPYLQSIFSTRYAHIRKPVRLKPCVQWTPLGKRKEAAQRSKIQTLITLYLHLYCLQWENMLKVTNHANLSSALCMLNAFT